MCRVCTLCTHIHDKHRVKMVLSLIIMIKKINK